MTADEAKLLAKNGLALRLRLVPMLVKGWAFLILMDILICVVSGPSFSIFFAHAVAVGMCVYFTGNRIEWKRKQLWQLFKGTPLYLGQNQDEALLWMTENIPHTDWYALYSKSAYVFRDGKHAVMVRMMFDV